MDVKTTDNYMSCRPLLRFMWMSKQLTTTSVPTCPECDLIVALDNLAAILPIHSVTIQIQSEIPRTLNEAHADVKTTDMFRMFAFGFTKKRQTKIRVKIATEEQKIRFKVQTKIVARCGSSLPTPKQECDGQQQWPKFLTDKHSAYRG